MNEWFWSFLSFLLINIFFVFFIIVSYQCQSRFRYPFLKLKKFGNKWKWFYYANPHIQEISRKAVFPSKEFEKTQKPYLEGLREFVKNYREETLDKELSDNIQQLYLLQVHNYYKNKFFLFLVHLRLWSFYGSFGFSVLLSIWLLFRR